MPLRVGKKYKIRRQITPQRLAAKERRRESLRRTTTGMIAVTLLIIAGGVGYTWYVGDKETAAIAIEEPVPSRRISIEPTKQDPNANVGVSVQMISSPVAPGANASVSIRTNQLANCTIAVTYDEIAAVDTGLANKKADAYGTVSWSWTVPQSTPKGKAKVKIDCATKKKSGSVTTDLIIQ
jgi:hypothetical protein